MKILPLKFLCILLLFPAHNARADKPPLAEALKDWTTIRVTAAFHGSDFEPSHPFLLLQRLNPDQIVFSSSSDKPGHPELPVARAIVTPVAAQQIIDRAFDLYTQASREIGESSRIRNLSDTERREVLKNRTSDINSLAIRIQVLSGGEDFDYEDDFADDGKGFGALLELISPRS